MAINEDLIQELRYFWVKDIGVQVDNALASGTTTPSTTPTTESTPDTLTSSTINQIGAGLHTHAIDAVSDASAVGNYGKLLKAGTTGGLGLGPGGLAVAGPVTAATLGVSGATTLNGMTDTGSETIAGDLTAGAGTLRVNAAGGRIGIGMAADPQFMLDVAGPVRAPYFIGKHAIQLSDALMICHYDGKESDLTGAAEGHRGQAATLIGGVTWQKGKFSKAVAIGEATTNLHGNPDFESGVGGWITSGGSSIAHISDKSWLGKSCGKATLLAAGYVYYPVTCAATTQYSYSAYVWSDVPATISIQLSDLISSSLSSGSLSIPAKTWTRVLFTGTTTSTTSRYFLIQNAGGSTANIYIDGCQVEQKPYTTPYTPSTRAAAGIRYLSDGNFDRAIGTVMFWVNLGGGNSTGSPRQIVRVDTTSGTLALLANTSGQLEYYWGSTASTATAAAISPNVWHHVVLTNDGAGTLTVYLDGAQVATNATGATLSSVSAFGGAPMIDVGQYSGNGSLNMNGFLDELAFTATAISPTLVKAIYDSDAPVFAESSTFSFRIPKSTVWADENGLFVISDAGNPVMGAIAATGGFSWGGQTLQSGDFLLGYGNNYLKWDKTATKLLLSAGDALTTIDNTGMTLSGGTTYDARSSITFKYSGSKVGDIYGVNQTAGFAYSKLVMESRPALNSSWGAVQILTTRRDSFGSESPFTYLILTSEDAANAGSKEDLTLDGTIRRSFTRQYSLDLLEYGSKLFYSFGPNLFQWFALQGGVGCHFHLVLKPSSGAVFVTSSTILSGGAGQPFTISAGEVVTVSMPSGVLQWVRTSGTNTYSGCVDITLAL